MKSDTGRLHEALQCSCMHNLRTTVAPRQWEEFLFLKLLEERHKAVRAKEVEDKPPLPRKPHVQFAELPWNSVKADSL